jgi:hypothetical protein
MSSAAVVREPRTCTASKDRRRGTVPGAIRGIRTAARSNHRQPAAGTRSRQQQANRETAPADFREKKNMSDQSAKRVSGVPFSHPDCHCRFRTFTGSTVRRSLLELASGSRTEGAGRLAGPITAGGDFHPAPKGIAVIDMDANPVAHYTKRPKRM